MLRQYLRLSLFLGALLWLSVPAPAYGWIGGLSKLAKLGKAGASAAKLAKVAKVAPATKAAFLAGGSAFAAERAALAFATFPDDAARAASYVAREPDGVFRVVTRTGEQSTHALDDLGTAVRAASAEKASADVVLDLTAARAADDLPALAPGDRYFVLDANGKTHAVRSVQGEGGPKWVVDVGGDAIDLADFASAALGEEDDSVPTWFYALLGAAGLGLIAFFWHKHRPKPDASPA
jgi:hypothetical protein